MRVAGGRFFCAGAFCPTAATTSRRHNFRFVLRSPTLLVVWLATIAVAGCARIGLPWSSGSEGSWIGLCADSLATPTARKRVPVTGDSGKRQALVIGDSAITGCTGTPIALGEHAVLWAGLSSGPNTEGVDLIGRDRNGAFDVDEQISLPAPPEPAEAGGRDPTAGVRSGPSRVPPRPSRTDRGRSPAAPAPVRLAPYCG